MLGSRADSEWEAADTAGRGFVWIGTVQIVERDTQDGLDGRRTEWSGLG